MKKLYLFRRAAATVTAVAVAVGSANVVSLAAASEFQPMRVADATQEKELRLWYDEPAPDSNEGWEQWSIPLGCGYLGANVFGRTDSERIQLTENSLSDIVGGENGAGLNNFSETYLDFGHDFSKVSGYSRDLSLNDSIATVEYDYEGVHYSREYFTSYPDKVMAIKLDASEAGKLNFTLRPTIPFLGDRKSGTVVADGDTITLSGVLKGANVQFEGQYKVIPQDGTLNAVNDANGDNGVIQVQNATSVVILIAVGTNYEIDPQVFLNANEDKLKGFDHPHEKVTQYLKNAAAKSYDELKQAHIEDYTTYFDRVRFDLGSEVPDITTDELLAQYKAGNYNHYLEELYFQYGRYLLISSSRKGTLPPNLQGIWNCYEAAPWTGGYWHNINIQMNYWPVFNTNLAEMFESYVDFYNAYLPAVTQSSSNFIQSVHPNNYDPSGNNGWSIGTGINPYSVYVPSGTGTDGNGTGALMAKSFWEYYDFTRDEDILENVTYPAVSGAANFMSRVVEPHGDYLLADPSSSPEQMVGGTYYTTVGSAWDQELAYEMEADALRAAKLLGKENEELPQRFASQIDKLDPINIGYSGQIKEYREENFYGEIAEYNHRHISQLVGLYPGTLVNSTTPAWMDAAKTTLNLRGDQSTGWAMAHRLNAWARTKDGNRSYTLFQTLLKNGTLNNLWDTHPPFQIDGNFGGTSGVAEMLLQSHEGYIAPLSAIPDAWTTGSYRGLVARGNFEVGADWNDGQATQFIIDSNAGGTCKIGYYNIADATVTDSSGNLVEVTTEGTDLISFESVEGETYTITDIPAYEETATPANLNLNYKDNGNTVVLSWTGSEDAVSYNVYRADGNEPDYTLVQSGVTETQVEITNTDLDQNQQHTFRVTAVAENGRESQGATAIMYPLSAPESATAGMLDDTTIQISMSSVRSADCYHIYKKTENGLELVMTTKYPAAVIENVSSSDSFAVSAESQSRESDTTDVIITDQSTFDNVLLNKTITSDRGILSDFPLSNALDGDLSTRYAVSDQPGPYSITIDLGGSFSLGTMQIYEFQNPGGETRSNETTIELSSDGGVTWNTIIDKQPLDADGVTEFNLGGASGSMMKITYNHTVGSVELSATIHEIICSGETAQLANKLELQKMLSEAEKVDISTLNPSVAESFQASMDYAIDVFSTPAIGQTQIDQAVKQLKAELTYINQVNVALNCPVTVSVPSIGAPYTEDTMVDGDVNTRYAGSDEFQELEVEIDLQQACAISRVSVDEYLDGGTRGGETTVQVYNGNEWVTVVDKQSLSGQRVTWFQFDEIVGNKVKFIFKNTSFEALITIYELQVLGIPQEVAEPANKSSLKFYLDKANAVNQEVIDSLVESAQTKFTAVLKNGQKVYDDVTATQEEVNAAAKELRVALNMLSMVAGDKEALIDLIAEAEDLIANAGNDYPQSAIDELQKAIDTAQEIVDDGDAFQADVDKAYNDLLDAIEAFNESKLDWRSLEAAVADAANVQTDIYNNRYVEDAEAFKAFDKAYEAAQGMLESKTAENQETIDTVTTALLEACANLRYKADKTTLEAVIGEAETVDVTLYTASSVATFRSALASANTVLADESLSTDSQTTVDNATVTLEEAIAALVPIETATADDGDNTTGTTAGSTNTTAAGGENETADTAIISTKTGDSNLLSMAVAVIVLATGTGFLFRKKRK